MHHPDDRKVRKVEEVNFHWFGPEIYTDTFFAREASAPLRLPCMSLHCHAVSCVVTHAASHRVCVCVACNHMILRMLNREPCDLSEPMYTSARLHLSRGAQTRAPSINWQKLRKSCLTAQTASKAPKERK